MRRAAIHGLAAGETCPRRRGDRMDVVRIRVIEIVVVDDVDVADHRVVHVDEFGVVRPIVVPGMKRFTPTQREPAHTDPDADSKAEVEPAT